MTIQRTIFILGGSSDIGRGLARRYLKAGHRVIVTTNTNPVLDEVKNLHAFKCDVTDDADKGYLFRRMTKLGYRWDRFISCVGQLYPIGPFFKTNISGWRESVEINALQQIEILHSFWGLADVNPGVAFMAGGGTNGPMTNYSAYCASKIFLIKMAELLADENPDLNIFVLGPGYVKTKIHEQTLAAGERAGANLQKTLDFLKTDGTSIDQIFNAIEWGFSHKEIVSGMNMSLDVLGGYDLGKLRRVEE